MADIFSAGIYVFIFRSLFICYNKIYLTDSTKKEDKFYTIALTIADKIPNLLEICQALYIYSLLTGNNMQDLSRDLKVLKV
ncbi:unnamed protein product [Fusarium fujikuroi]|uniref:Uncharacterized protein n=1 Tax=Fusarium fujikuroi TaxID=5127 RepID=A0A9Q9U5X4_FUSFU|nr:unnamed protein product [Fusarium fujikuroi]